MNVPPVEEHCRPVRLQSVRPPQPLRVAAQLPPPQLVLRRRGALPERQLLQAPKGVPAERAAGVLAGRELDVFPLLEADQALRLPAGVEPVSEACGRV